MLNAAMAQVVEHILGKDEVTSSNLVSSSRSSSAYAGELLNLIKKVCKPDFPAYRLFLYIGNTAQPAANAFARHLLASFPSYCPNSP